MQAETRPGQDRDANTMQNKTKKIKLCYKSQTATPSVNTRRLTSSQPEVPPNGGCGQCAALVKLPVKQHKSNYRQKEQQCGAPAAMTHSYELKFKIKDGGGGRVQTTEFY